MKDKKRVELLAPAGSPEAFYGAINAGADAVYLAGNKYGARAFANNFTTEELIGAIEYAHLFQCKVYLTINTLMKDAEMDDLFDYVCPYYEAGLDGVIIQDFGVFSFLKEHFPGLELHASTQMSLCTEYGAEFLKRNGASRIVPAREVSLTELKEIKQKVDIELETFIHGAMCYCYSGQCLFSSILGGRSGNRGRCAQPCRLPYSVTTDSGKKKEGHFLSLKDMCTIKDLPALIDAGIDSFKIEGRMKRAEYVAGVVSIYRKYIDLYDSLKEKYGADAAKYYKVDAEDLRILNSLYIRSEIQNGYYFKHNGREMITIDSPAYCENDETLLHSIHEKYLEANRKRPITMNAVFTEGCNAYLIVQCGTEEVVVEGEIVTAAQNKPISEENIDKQLRKLGDTPFEAEEINVILGDQVFYPLKQINEMRRQACSELKAKLLAPTKRTKPVITAESKESTGSKMQSKGSRTVSVETEEQLQALVPFRDSIQYLYINSDILPDVSQKLLQEFTASGVHLYALLPYVMRQQEQEYYNELDRYMKSSSLIEGVVLRSVDQLGYYTDSSRNWKIRTDAGLYTWNRYSSKFYSEYAENLTIPYELKAAEQRQLPLDQFNYEKILYSYIPMMVTANCICKTTDRCVNGQEKVRYLKDRTGKDLPYLNKCRHCMNVIYNTVPFSLLHLAEKWQGSTVQLRVDFTIEKSSEVQMVMEAFVHGMEYTSNAHTTGHEKRGVE